MNIYLINDAETVHFEFIANNIYQLPANGYSIERDEARACNYLKVNTERVIEPRIVAHTTEDKMSAAISIYPPINSTTEITLDYILEELALRKKIAKQCVDVAKFDDILDKLNNGYAIERLECVSGKAAQHGENAKVEFFFDKPVHKPKILPNGSVDFKQVSDYIMVKQNQLLVRMTPATSGEKGYDVSGTDILPIPGVRREVFMGSNIYANDDKTEYRAELGGFVVYVNNTISVNPMLKIYGDVDLKVGNIEFDGPVHISNNVLTGFMVKGEDIVIDGVDEDAILIAQNDITIKTGIKGLGSKGYVKAGGDVSVGYCENASIQAAGNVEINKYSFNSKIYAQSVNTVQGDSVISGGLVRAFSSIRIASAGTKGTNDMLLAVGISPIYSEKAKKITEELERLKDALEKVNEVLSQLDLTNVNVLKNPKVVQLKETATILQHKIPTMQEKHDELMEKAMCSDPVITVEKLIRAGVQVQFYDEVITISTDMNRVEFYFDRELNEIAFRQI